jgi:predicted ATP-dependent endonuclease of OLD family
MHLKSVEIRNFRSLYDEGDGSFKVALSGGLNVLVGRNNCGKSNILRAIALAMDPEFPFDKGWRYDLNLWIGHSLEGAAYLPR